MQKVAVNTDAAESGEWSLQAFIRFGPRTRNQPVSQRLNSTARECVRWMVRAVGGRRERAEVGGGCRRGGDWSCGWLTEGASRSWRSKDACSQRLTLTARGSWTVGAVGWRSGPSLASSQRLSLMVRERWMWTRQRVESGEWSWQAFNRTGPRTQNQPILIN
ncbi:hypothetical protein BKA81DRAFT_228143 [Phyllosticta paracitricarpa]